MVDTNTSTIARGISSLNNMGNTCYMNSTLQALSNTNIFCYYMRKTMFKEKLKNGIMQNIIKKLKSNPDIKEHNKISKKKFKYKFKSSITYRLYQVLKIMWSVNCELTPEKFKSSVDTIMPKFKGFNQHDAQEFLIFLLDQIHEETKSDITIKKLKLNTQTIDYLEQKEKLIKEDKKEELKELISNNYLIDVQYEGIKFHEKFLKNNHSIITDLFYGIFMNVLECMNCKNKSITYEAFNILQLELLMTNQIDLNELLKHYFKSEEVEYKCSICSHEKSIKNITIHTLPEKLIIQLKRFISNGRQTGKHNGFVNFPFEKLQMSEIIKSELVTYNLYSVINHMGGTGGGHYTNYSKNSMDNNWYEFNDSNMNLINNTNIIVDSSAYVLLYEKLRV
jgi:ubiquitin carboxyl-terminal hydrolase 8